jgi:arylsulfatase A-like enzyme
VLLAISTLACPSREKKVVYDLAARATIAELTSAREVVLFGTPAAEPHLADGFYREPAKAGAEGFVWAREDCQISFTWPQAAARAAVLDLAPYRGVKGQKAQVLLNEQPVGAIEVDARRRQRLELPAALQRAGENRIKLVFASTASPQSTEPGSDDDRHLAAALYNIVVGAADDPVLVDALGRDAPRPLAAASEKGAPELTQVGTSSLRYAIQVPKGAELRFTPDLHPAARRSGASVRFRVTMEDVAGQERELWSEVVDARDAKPRNEVGVALAPRNDDGIVRVGLHVAGLSGDRFAWGTWKAPRIVADRGVDILAPLPYTAEERRRGDAIRDGMGPLNVLFVILDAGRAEQFGCYGYRRATTPNIDAVAREGVVFENAFTPAVYTLAAMSAVWTSQYPERHEDAAFGAPLPKDKLTLAELLSGQGITNAGFVANIMAGKRNGLERGFQEFEEVFVDYGSEADSFEHFLPQWLKGHRDGRFFAYVHYREPHLPYDPPPPFDTRFGGEGPISKADRRREDFFKEVSQGRRTFSKDELDHLVRLYDGNLAFADQEFGKLRQWMEAEGLWERTLVIVAADHGEQLYEHRSSRVDTARYIGHNVQLYEQSVHVPLVLRFPSGKGPSGRRVAGLVDLLDVAPTIADAFGVLGQAGSNDSFEGRSLFPMIAGAAGKNAILSRTLWDRPWYALRTEREKLLYHSGTGEVQLFDLKGDPHEDVDRHEAEPLRTAYYRETIRATIARLATRAAKPGTGRGIVMTRAECENLKSLGYVTGTVDCRQYPESR